MLRKTLIAVALAVGFGLAASPAQAAYNINERTAERYAKQAVLTLYASFEVEDVVTFCRPQRKGQRVPAGRIPSYLRFHRWTCYWTAALNSDGEIPYGQVLVAGNTGAGRFSYMAIHGGIKWL